MRIRDKRLYIRVTEEEGRFRREKAQKQGMTITDYIINCSLDKNIYILNGLEDVILKQKEIGRYLDKMILTTKMNNLSDDALRPVIDGHIKVTEMIGSVIRKVK